MDAEAREREASRKASLWSAVAGLSQLVGATADPLGLRAATVIGPCGLAFVLPAIALLHARNVTHRASGAMLASLLGGAVVVLGMIVTESIGLRPAWLVLLGMWWWTLGKMSYETGTLPRAFGMLTAAGGALAFVLAISCATLVPSAAAVAFKIASLLLGAWLLSLAILIARA